MRQVDVDDRHALLEGKRTHEQCLPGARRPVQQHATRRRNAQPLIDVGRAQRQACGTTKHVQLPLQPRECRASHESEAMPRGMRRGALLVQRPLQTGANTN